MPVLKPVFFLHGTSSVYLPFIQKEGLKNPYLTDLEKMASYFAGEADEFERKHSRKDSRPIVLQVAIFDTARLTADEEMWASPLDWIKQIHHIQRDQEWFEAVREGYIDSPAHSYDWQTSIKVVHAVKYEGTIPPKHLGVARKPRA